MVEPVAPVDQMSFGDAADLLHAVRSGTAGDEPPYPPVLVVRLDDTSPGDTASHRIPHGGQPLRPPVLWPCVVVALHTASGPGGHPPPGNPPAGADVYLTDAPDPPRPWVTSPDPDDLVAAVRDHPQAGVTVAQVLRAHTGEVERDLLTESLAYAALQAGAEHRRWLDDNRGRHRNDDDDSPSVSVERTGASLEVVLDRPARRNAYSSRMRDELVAALQLAASDPTITSVRLRGNGPSFCSGGDLAEFGTVDDAATAHQIRMTRNAGHLAYLVAGRLTAHVHGACVGAGVELPSFAGRCVAREGTTFRLPEVGMGLIPGAGGTASIPRRIGRQRAAWLALTGRDLDASTALSWRLVDSVTPA